MPSPLEQLEPRAVWSHFDGIRQVPRPSKHEEKIAGHVRRWAGEHGFPVVSDAAGNLVVSVPASAGREDAPTVVLQAHLDMVCEKNDGVAHDFLRDPIQVRRDGDWVRSVGTTLGADNGLGAAAAMAAAVDPEMVHGPLELLFTLDEETGLTGASAFDGALVSGRLLLNLDSEEDGAVYIGCAGAAGVVAEIPLERRAAEPGAKRHVLSVRGLAGGHSGIDIGGRRGNAIKVMVRLLGDLFEADRDLALTDLSGGSARNAIARECFAGLLAGQTRRDHLDSAVARLADKLAGEYVHEPGLEIVLEARQDPGAASLPVVAASRDRLLETLAAAPHGVLAMSAEVPGLVETSNNLALVATDTERARIVCCCRSSSNPALADTMFSLRSLFRLAGAEIEEEPGYPGWAPRPDSPLVRRTIAAYEALFAEAPEIKAVHAGLECGILTQKAPGLDAVSIGPEILGAHSPDERVRISSVAKFYRLLGRLLADLATTPRGSA